jgi:hypothetical protein
LESRQPRAWVSAVSNSAGGVLERDLRAQGRRYAGRADDRRQHPAFLVAAETPIGQPIDEPLGKADVAGLRRRLHERGRDPHELGRHVLPAVALSAGRHGRLAGLVEEGRGLLDPPCDRVADRGVAEGQRVVGAGLEKPPARLGGGRELLGAELELGPRRQQAGSARRLLLQPLHLVERGRNLVSLDEPVELLEVADQFGAAELELLAGASRARGVGVDGHGATCSRRRRW